MRISLDVDISRLERTVYELGEGPEKLTKRMAFATNRAALRVQREIFAHVRKRQRIKSPASERLFFGSQARPGGVAAKLVKRASVRERRAYAEIATGAEAVGNKRRVLFPEFETGGTQKPDAARGQKRIVQPILGRPARPSINRPVPPSYTLQGLKLREYQGGKRVRRKRRAGAGRTKTDGVGVFNAGGTFTNLGGPSTQVKGLQRTFMLRESEKLPDGGVLQRFGPKRGDVRVIHKFFDEQPITKDLDWMPTARINASRFMAEELERERNEAIAHALGKVAR